MTVSPPILLDNTVLTNFALAECAELVMQLWGDDLRTTPHAMAEHQEGVALGYVPEGEWKDLPRPELKPEEEALFQQLPTSLGPGESSCLAVAFCQGGTLATDDLPARRQAGSKAVTVTGTLGILISCIRNELIDLSEGNRLLKVMIENNYHSPASSLDEYL